MTAGPPMRADARRNRARILAAAQSVFAEHGPAGSTEEVARRADVAIGTVFRHFPTKQALLQAIVKEHLAQLTADAERLASSGDPATALFTFFRAVVGEAAAASSVVALLGEDGIEITVDGPLGGLADVVGALLSAAQHAGAIRPEVVLDEVMALLISTTQGALRAGWDARLRDRVLDIVFAGLAPRR